MIRSHCSPSSVGPPSPSPPGDILKVARSSATPITLLGDGTGPPLEWTDPDGFRDCGFLQGRDGLIAHQRGYWDSLQLEEIHPEVH